MISLYGPRTYENKDLAPKSTELQNAILTTVQYTTRYFYNW